VGLALELSGGAGAEMRRAIDHAAAEPERAGGAADEGNGGIRLRRVDDFRPGQ
jgi:hypothetical protein